MKICKNCGNYIDYEFCGKCGQKTGIIEENKLHNERSDFFNRVALAKEQRKRKRVIITIVAFVIACIVAVFVCLELSDKAEIARMEKAYYEKIYGYGSYEKRNKRNTSADTSSKSPVLGTQDELDRKVDEILNNWEENCDYIPFDDKTILSQLETMSAVYRFSESGELKVMHHKHKETGKSVDMSIHLISDEVLTTANASAVAVSFFDFVESSWLLSGIADLDCDSISYTLNEGILHFLFIKSDGVFTCSSPSVLTEFQDAFKDEYENRSTIQMFDLFNVYYGGLS